MYTYIHTYIHTHTHLADAPHDTRYSTTANLYWLDENLSHARTTYSLAHTQPTMRARTHRHR